MRVWLGVCSVLPELLSGRLTCQELPALAAEHGFNGLDWMDRLLPSWRKEEWGALGRACQQAGLGPGGLNLSLTYTASQPRLERKLAHLQRLLARGHLLQVQVVRLALDRGGLSINNILEILASLRPASSRRHTPLGPLARAAYGALNRFGLTGDQGRRLVAPPRASHDELQAAVHPLDRLAETARGLGLSLGLENHWGLTSHPADMLALLGLLDSPHLGICLDLGNFYQDQDALAGVALLAPSAVQVHYKAQGEDLEQEALILDYPARLGLLKDAGYHGAFSVEYEGPRPGLAGAAAAARVLRRLWHEA